MKKTFRLTTILLCICYTLSAQNFSEGIQTEHTFSSGSNPALQIRFDKVSEANVKNAAKAIFKQYDAKISGVKETDNEYTVSDFKLEGNQKVSNGRLKIQEADGNTNLYAFFKTNESVISEQLTPNEIIHYKNLVKSIARKAVINEFNLRMEQQEKKINEENKKLKTLEKNENSEHKNIGKYEMAINSFEQEIEQVKSALAAQEISIAKNNDLLKAKESEIAGKSVKALDSEISSIKKENKSLRKSIDKYKKNIAEIKGEIAILNSTLKGNEAEKITLKSSDSVDKKARKRLKKLNKEGLKTLGEIEENKVLIVNQESNITELENDIKSNRTKIDLLESEIAEHNEDALKEQLSLLEKEAKSLNQEKRNFQKRLTKANEKINDNKEDIRLSKLKITNLKATQENQKSKIEEALKKLKLTQNSIKKLE